MDLVSYVVTHLKNILSDNNNIYMKHITVITVLAIMKEISNDIFFWRFL